MLLFEWDSNKAKRNVEIHGITFDEASTVFNDRLSLTIYDPLHSDVEDRFVIIGSSYKNRLLVVVHTERGDNIRIISARKANIMKKMHKDPDMLEEYDFSKGVRGKYAKRYAEGTNVVVIEPDVAKYFPDHDAVNEALRSLAEIIQKQEQKHNKTNIQVKS